MSVADARPGQLLWRAWPGTVSAPGCLLAEPVVESRRTEASASPRQQGALAQSGPEVPGFRIGDHDALIPRRAQALAHEVLEAQRFGPGDLDRVVQRGAERDVADR